MAQSHTFAGTNFVAYPITTPDGTVAYLLGTTALDTAGAPVAGGGGGGASTIADGADVAEGATTATSYSDATGGAAGTVVALNKGQYVLTAAMSAKLPSSVGAKTGALSLSVVPNTDTPFLSSQSGTWNIANISGTISLPTGAATSANQTSELTKLDTLHADLIAATPAGANVIGGVTIADGSDAAEGAKADAAYAGSGSASLIAIGKGSYAALVAATPAGTNLIGKVGIDQTTPGTTNGTVPAGNVASGAADSGNPVKVGGVYNSTPPTLTTGQRGNMQLDVNGNQQVRLMLLGGNIGDAVPASNVGLARDQANANNLMMAMAQSIYNGASYDRVRKTNIYKRVASSAASGNPDFLKASAGDVTKFWGLCGATAAYLQIYNKASAPTVGTDTPVLTYPIVANSAFTDRIEGGGYFSTGIAFAFTTDAAGTTGSAAAAITSFALMGA